MAYRIRRNWKKNTSKNIVTLQKMYKAKRIYVKLIISSKRAYTK